MSETFKQLSPYLEKAQALKTAINLFEWDNETCAPPQAGPFTAKMIGTLSSEYFNIVTDEKVKELVQACKEDASLTEIEAAIIFNLMKNYDAKLRHSGRALADF